MSDPPIDSRPSTPATEQRTRELVGTIDRIAARQRKAERERGRNFWVEVSRVGTLGWLLALPIIGGALIGHLIDRRLETGMSFALGLLGVGLALAGYALYRHGDEFPRDD
jgi:ATP synthase protein I